MSEDPVVGCYFGDPPRSVGEQSVEPADLRDESSSPYLNQPILNPNECGAEMSIGDDFGDNSATILCQFRKNHPENYHMESYNDHDRDDNPIIVRIVWQTEEQKREHPITIQPLNLAVKDDR